MIIQSCRQLNNEAWIRLVFTVLVPCIGSFESGLYMLAIQVLFRSVLKAILMLFIWRCKWLVIGAPDGSRRICMAMPATSCSIAAPGQRKRFQRKCVLQGAAEAPLLCSLDLVG